MRRDKQVNVALSIAEYTSISEDAARAGYPHVTEYIRATMREKTDERRKAQKLT